jgi:uncharacterized membrane protein
MKTRNDHNSKSLLARSLGYLALGLGTAELFTCKRVARLIGLAPTPWTLRTLRALGLRELLTGAGLLGRRPTPWLAARVAGDALDLSLLLAALRRKKGIFGGSGRTPRLRVILGGVAGVSALDFVTLGLSKLGRTSKTGEPPVLRASITVRRTPADVYSFWRNFENFPRFVRQLESVNSPDKIRSRWKAKLANQAIVEWDATIVEDTPDQRLVWKVQSPTMRLLVDTIEARFELAPGDQGTEVHVAIHGSRLEKPAATARWLRKLPEGLLFDGLRRFKQLIELGEITQSDSSIHQGPFPARPSPREELPSEEAAFEAAPTKPTLTFGAPS